MNQSRYYNTAVRMDEAFLELLEKKDFEYITVKEICAKAGVNRSTFYLHYETVGDLLDECVEYIKRKFHEQMRRRGVSPVGDISSAGLEQLIFITPKYLTPYFEFVRDNRLLFKIAITRPTALNSDKSFAAMFNDVISPILDRFNYPADRKDYVGAFYVSGLIAVVSEWIKRDCADPIASIIDICIGCILPNGADAHLPTQ